MPEGDTIHHAANRIRAALEGRVPDALRTPHPRLLRDRWPERLDGLGVESVRAHGKHLLIGFERGWTIHSHLRMTGAWRVGERSRTPTRRDWLVIEHGETGVVQLGGPLLELLHAGRAAQLTARLGPDILAPELDAERFLANLRAGDPKLAIGEALLDQRVIAGIGNLWKNEGCFEARISPWRSVGALSDAQALAIVEATRPRMQRSAADGMGVRERHVHDRAGGLCPRCGAGTRIAVRGQGDGNRATFWCPRCQE